MGLFSALALSAAVVQLVLLDSATAADSPLITHRPQNSEKVDRVKRQQFCSFSAYRRMMDALDCQEDYLDALSEEIDNSKCRNEFYSNPESSYHDNNLCAKPADTRSSLRNCTDECSQRQFYYMACSNLREQYRDGLVGCNNPPNVARDCLFDKGDFCFLKQNQTNAVLIECYATSNVTALDNGRIDCSARCRAAVNAYRENSGCCANYWRFEDHFSGPSIENIFTTCQVELPEECANYNTPPSDFLDCARAGQSALSANTAVIFTASLSLLLALMLQ